MNKNDLMCKWAQCLFSAITDAQTIKSIKTTDFEYGGRIDFIVNGSEYPKLGYGYSILYKDMVIKRFDNIIKKGGNCYALRISGLKFTKDDGSTIMYGKHILISTKTIDGSLSIEKLVAVKDDPDKIILMLQMEAKKVLSTAEMSQVEWCVPSFEAVINSFSDLLK